MTSPALQDPTIVAPGFVNIATEWLGEVNGFAASELAHITINVLDIVTFNNAIDPELVTLKYVAGTAAEASVVWQYSAWDQITIPFPVQTVGVLSRTNQGQFETWLDTTNKTGIWKVQAFTTGAGQGCSLQQQFYVTPTI